MIPAGQLSKLELSRLKDSLCAWRTADEMLSQIDEVPDFALLSQTGTSFLREAWLAGMMAKVLLAEAARLSRTDPPDFLLKRGTAERAFEATEAIDAKSRRSAKYRVATSPQLTPLEPEPDPNTTTELIMAAVAKKLSKTYDENTSLLVYWAHSDFRPFSSEIINVFARSTEAAKDKFLFVCVFWKNRLFPLWLRGQPISSTDRFWN